jgi:rRNA maturation endonuclease Nob1
MTNKNKLVVVDTNCLVRVYFSPLRPILARPVAGYELKTLAELADELKELAKGHDMAWLSDKGLQQEVDGAVIELTKAQKRIIRDDAPAIRRYGDGELHKYCIAQRSRNGRTLSMTDAKALATALELRAALATDEWPLRHVADFYDDDDGNPVELFSSVELLWKKKGFLVEMLASTPTPVG